MRRDMDLIRGLLLKLEALETTPGGFYSLDPHSEEFAIEGYTQDEIEHHLSMIYRAGFVDYGSGSMGSLSGNLHFGDLTWEARDFLDAVREPKVWVETKTRAEKVGGWTVGILTDIAKGYLRAKAAEHGIPFG